jgi:hypothetical protein
MPTSLIGLGARIDRLASRIGSAKDGRKKCHEDERRPRYAWGVVSPDAPQSTECSAWGRVYSLTYVTYGWLSEEPAS